MALKVSRLLHAGYLFESAGVQIAFDPIFESPFSVNCYAFPAVEFDAYAIRQLSLSAVFISHTHDDHCSLESLNLLNRETPIYIFASDETVPQLIRALGFSSVTRLQTRQTMTLGPFTITVHEALDVEIDSIIEINVEGLNVLNVIDSWIGPKTMDYLKTKTWDFILWPFQTMRELDVLSPSRAKPASRSLPPEWLEQIAALKPRTIVPSSCQFQFESWSWFNQAFFPISYAQFKTEVSLAAPTTEVLRLNPGASTELSSDHLLGALTTMPRLPWIKPIGDQNVDYTYDALARPKSTLEIARQLPALSEKEFERVVHFCEIELIEKLNANGPEFFSDIVKAPRVWTLSVFEHSGEARHFRYNVRDGRVGLAKGEDRIAWLTEIPAVKLLGALEQGESLTSLYIRINDVRFSPDIEAHIAQLDSLADPLLSVLFRDSVGAYQQAQLKRLLKSSSKEL